MYLLEENNLANFLKECRKIRGKINICEIKIKKYVQYFNQSTLDELAKQKWRTNVIKERRVLSDLREKYKNLKYISL